MADQKKYPGLTAYLDGAVEGVGHKKVAIIERIESQYPGQETALLMSYRKAAEPHHLYIAGITVLESRGPVMYVLASKEEPTQNEIASIVPGYGKKA